MSVVEIWYFLENVKVFSEILAMLHLSDSKFSQMYLKKQFKRALFTLNSFFSSNDDLNYDLQRNIRTKWTILNLFLFDKIYFIEKEINNHLSRKTPRNLAILIFSIIYRG